MLDILSGSSAKCPICTPAVAVEEKEKEIGKIEFKIPSAPSNEMLKIRRQITAQQRALIDAMFKGPPPVHPTATEIQEMIRQKQRNFQCLSCGGHGWCNGPCPECGRLKK